MFYRSNDDETMYCDAIGKLLAQVAPVQRVQALDNRKAFDFELHQALAEVGAWGVGVDESLGGSGGGPVLQVLTLEMLGQRIKLVQSLGESTLRAGAGYETLSPIGDQALADRMPRSLRDVHMIPANWWNRR